MSMELLMARARLNHLSTSQASPAAVLQSNGGQGSSTTPSVTLTSAPTTGNYLLFVLYSAAAPSAVPAGFTEYVPCTIDAGGRSQRVYYRKVQAGDSATQSMTIGSATYWVAHLLEVQHVASGLSSGVTVNAAGSASFSLTIPAGVSNALPIVFTGYSNIGFSEAWQTPTGFTQITEIAQNNNVALVSFSGNALSSGAAITASPMGFTTGSHNLGLAGGFLIN